MVDNDITVPTSLSRICLCFLVFKSNKIPRFCSDFPKVNKVTKLDSLPLPASEGWCCQTFENLILRRVICRFPCPRLRTAGHFQCLGNCALTGLAGCAVYLKDFVVYSDTWILHLHTQEHCLTDWQRLSS